MKVVNRFHCKLWRLLFLSAGLLVGAWSATQYVAHEAQAIFELPGLITQIGGAEIYFPWMFFAWQELLSDTHAAALSVGNLIFVLFVSLSLAFGLFISHSADNRHKSSDIYGSAHWASRKVIKALGLLSGRGVILGQLPDGFYLRHDGPEHYAIIAPTRSGKGAGVVIPTLLAWPESVLVYDLKEENWRATSGHRQGMSHVIYFNPNCHNSAHFNPLMEVRRGEQEVRDVQNIADMITDPDGSGYSDHWIKTGHSLLVGAILHILYSAPESEQNLAGVAKFLSNPEKNLVQTLTEMKNFPHLMEGKVGKPHPVIAQAARDMLNKSENERSGVLSTAMSFLTLYRDPIVARNIQDSDFRIDDLMNAERPISLYLVIPPSDINRLRPLIRLMVNQICRRLTEEIAPSTNRHRLLLMLDEFPALGRLDFFETALGFIAGYGIKAMLVAQSINQLRKIYGERNSILDNTHIRLFYAPNTIETGEYVSRCLGQATESFSTESEGGKKGFPWHQTRNVSKQFASRPLLTPGEVMELPADDAILFVGGQPPIRCKKARYYSDGNFQAIIDAPPPLNGVRPYPYGPPLTASDWKAVRVASETLDSQLEVEKVLPEQESVWDTEPIDEVLAPVVEETEDGPLW